MTGEGCHYSLDWTTGLEHWTGLLDYHNCMNCIMLCISRDYTIHAHYRYNYEQPFSRYVYTWCIDDDSMMSGTSAFPIVLDTDSELEDTEEEAEELLTTLKPKESPLKAVTIHWTGLLDWNTGLDYWTGDFSFFRQVVYMVSYIWGRYQFFLNKLTFYHRKTRRYVS